MATKKATGRAGGGWVVLGALALAVVVAVQTGWAGFGLAQLRSSLFPRDESLLEWVPSDTAAVVVIDPHQLKLESLGAEGSTARAALQRTRDDVKNATGIDLAFDVDKLVLTGTLAVARGRFDGKKLADKLAAHRYTPAEHEGRTLLAREGEDALAVIDDSVLLYGDAAGVRAGITAHEKGASLAKDEPMTERLRRVGWDHAVSAVVRVADDKPSVREILTGSTGPRSVGLAVSTAAGMDLDAQVEAASTSAAAELAKLLEEKRAADLGPVIGAEPARVLADVIKKATITADTAAGVVKIHAHLDPAQLDALAKQARAGLPLAQSYKALRLYQLLVP